MKKSELREIIREEIQNLNEGKTYADVFLKLPDSIDASSKGITSLEGSPETVVGNFHCSGNKLTSLEGAPKTVGGYFSCSFNKLKSLKGAPKIVKGDFVCRNNPVKFTKEDVKKVCKVGGKIIV